MDTQLHPAAHVAAPAAQPLAPNFVSSPLGIALLMLVSSIGGGWVKDRLSQETGGTTSAVRIEALSRRVEQLEQNELPAAQFREYQHATDSRLDDIRDSLKQIEVEIRTGPNRR